MSAAAVTRRAIAICIFDQYCKLVLLYIWNPVIGSIAGLQQAAGLDHVAKAMGVKRFSAWSFSESPRVFDPELLKPIIAEFAGELTGRVDPRLKDLDHVVTLVDGTVPRSLVALAKAACLGRSGQVRWSRASRIPRATTPCVMASRFMAGDCTRS